MKGRRGAAFGLVMLAVAVPGAARAEPRIEACADAAEHGQELRARSRLVEARQSFVSCAQRDCPAAVRDSCTEWLADLDRRLPQIVVGAKDQRGRDVRDVVVTLDGVRLPDLVTSSAVPADPGPHTLRAEAPGHDAQTEDLVLREGEPLRVIALTLKTTGDGTIAPPPPPPPPGEGAAPRGRAFPLVPVVLGATSVVALGIFGVVGATAASDYQSLEHDCSPHCSSDRIDGVRSRFVIADVALVAGVVTGLGALAFWLFDRPAPRQQASAQPR